MLRKGPVPGVGGWGWGRVESKKQTILLDKVQLMSINSIFHQSISKGCDYKSQPEKTSHGIAHVLQNNKLILACMCQQGQEMSCNR